MGMKNQYMSLTKIEKRMILMKMISLILKMKIETLILKSKEKKEHLESHPNFKNKEDESFLKLDRN